MVLFKRSASVGRLKKVYSAGSLAMIGSFATSTSTMIDDHPGIIVSTDSKLRFFAKCRKAQGALNQDGEVSYQTAVKSRKVRKLLRRVLLTRPAVSGSNETIRPPVSARLDEIRQSRRHPAQSEQDRKTSTTVI
jgi:hypothetical protein